MTKSERNQIIKWADTLTDEELEKEYYDAVWDTLGSDVLEELCYGRGIKLWEDANTFKTSCETCRYYDTDRDDQPCCSCVYEENWERSEVQKK